MTAETALFIRLSPQERGVAALIRDIRAAERRARKAMPGDRTDILRVETLSAQLERVAASEYAKEPHRGVRTEVVPEYSGHSFVDHENLKDRPIQQRSLIEAWVASGDTAVELRLPFTVGPTVRKGRLGEARSPERVWRIESGTPPKRATALRFQQQ